MADRKSLDELRAAIDDVDAELVRLLARRWDFVREVTDYKSCEETVSVPWRNQQVLENVANLAREEQLPDYIAKQVWQTIIDSAIEYEKEKIRSKP